MLRASASSQTPSSGRRKRRQERREEEEGGGGRREKGGAGVCRYTALPRRCRSLPGDIQAAVANSGSNKTRAQTATLTPSVAQANIHATGADATRLVPPWHTRHQEASRLAQHQSNSRITLRRPTSGPTSNDPAPITREMPAVAMLPRLEVGDPT